MFCWLMSLMIDNHSGGSDKLTLFVLVSGSISAVSEGASCWLNVWKSSPLPAPHHPAPPTPPPHEPTVSQTDHTMKEAGNSSI